MFRFEDPIYLWLLLAVPVLFLVRFVVWKQRKNKLKKFGDPQLLRQLMPDASVARPRVKFALLISFALNMMGNLNILNAERTAGSRLYAPTTALLPFVQTKAEDAIKHHQQSLAGKNDTTYIYFNRPSQPDDEHAQ